MQQQMRRTASLARSVLDCPGEVRVRVDGDVRGETSDAYLQLHDELGRPVLVCSLDETLALEAGSCVRVDLKVTSALPGEEALALSGRLLWARRETCQCCWETRDVVAVEIGRALLESGTSTLPIDPRALLEPGLELNEGFFWRSQAHVNLAHAEELRDAVSARFDVSRASLIGAQLVGLDPSGVEIQWVTDAGARAERLPFPVLATTTDEVRTLLCSALGLSC